MGFKVVAISDTHMQHGSLDMPEGDLLIHAGDALGRGTYSEAVRLNEWFGTLKGKYKYIIYVPGNHDELFEANPQAGRDVMTNAIVLIDEGIEIEGLKIYGSPYTTQFYDWSFMKPDGQLRAVWDKIPEGLDILITHGPAYGILDQNMRGDHCGSQTLYEALATKKPRYHIFGHIHESSGVFLLDPTTHINAAVLNDYYNLYQEPKVFEISTGD